MEISSQAAGSLRRTFIIPGVLGNMLEIYDFMIYGYFAPVIATLFFPTDSKSFSLVLTFSIFAIGFLMRPLGALIFGHFGDRLGRKKTLSVSVILMAVPTACIGLLPGYAQIGIWAGIALLMCRLLQGLAVGGEFIGSILYVTEHAPVNRRGFYGSWAMCGTFAGILLASAVSALLNRMLSVDTVQSWGWRLPFLAGAGLGVVGLYVRLKMPETPSFLAIQAQKMIVKNPLIQSFKQAWRPMGVVVGLNVLPAVAFYLLFVYLSSYLVTYLKMPLDQALTINTISVLLLGLLTPLAGLLSDQIGRKPILLSGAVGLVLFSYPLFFLLGQGTFVAVLLAQMGFSLLVCLVFAALPATLSELMATQIRYTAVALPYNISSALFGGTAPLLATYFITKTGNFFFPSFYLMIVGGVTVLSIFALKK